MMMMEEEDMEMEEEHEMFDAHEIDLNYEFDSPRFFDFTAPETLAQALQAQLWFETAASYPPSPFAAKLVRSKNDASASLEFINHDSKSAAEGGKISGLQGGVIQNVPMQPLQIATGLTFSSKKTNDRLNSKVKSAVKKSSTLMKPTACQLAKQNRPHPIVGSRSQKPLAQNKEMNVESQAAKRQKLEGGLLRKVGDVKQQTNFVHKAPQKAVTVEQNGAHSKLKITIPREPDLETAHRAERIRPKNASEAKLGTAAVARFKARPLNRKILNAPSLPLPKRSTPRLPEFQEFNLRTWERAMQHANAASSSAPHAIDYDKGLDKPAAVSAPENRTRDLRRPSAMGAPKTDGLDFAHNFKARPLNKKILSSKGDIGVFRNRKQETTVPIEFSFHTEKRVQHNPPIDLFSKLSLTSEVQSNNGSQLKSSMFRKDSKENIGSSFLLDRKESPFLFGGKQLHTGSDGCCEAGTMLSARRNLGIR